MNLTVHWNDVSSYFKGEVNVHRDRLANASRSTFAVLGCKGAPGEPPLFESEFGDHAEERLLQSPAWTQHVVHALESASEPESSPLMVMVMINRSPCSHCAGVLAKALRALEQRFPTRVPHQHFIVASRGYYHSAKHDKTGGGDPRAVTTEGALRNLQRAGWTHLVLQFHDELPRRAVELQRGLLRVRASLGKGA